METTAASRYQVLKAKREPALQRAREAASYTIPSLMPPEGQNEWDKLPESYQGFGARLVTSLSSRILIAMYPPGASSFRLKPTPEALLENNEGSPDQAMERSLSIIESLISSEIERRRWRAPTHTVIQHLIVCGNALERMLPDNSIKVNRLDQYVVVRDPAGNPIEVVIEEWITPASLPEALEGMIDVSKSSSYGTKLLPLYTWYRFQKGIWKVHQEFQDKTVPDSDGEYKVSPINALRWGEMIGTDYGRGKVEEHMPDIRAIDGFSKSAQDGAALSSRNLLFIRPNAAGGGSLNLRRRIAKANNGEVLTGDVEDIGFLQAGNVTGIQFAQSILNELKQELAMAFLMNSAARRDGERVTAYELRLMVEELEGVLGGVYSMLSQEMQGARLKRLILQMQASESIPQWDEDIIEPTVITGLEALGREAEVSRVVNALNVINGIPDDVTKYAIKWGDLLSRAFNGLQLPDSVYTEAEIQAKKQQEQEMATQQAVMQAGGQALAQQAAAPQPEGNQ